MSQLPQDVEEFISESSYSHPVVDNYGDTQYYVRVIETDDFRNWMTGHVRVPVEMLEFIEAKEHHLPIEDRHVLSVMLNASK